MLPILWLIQKQEGWVSEPAIRVVSEMLGMPVIRVLEVATFYTMFHAGARRTRRPDPGVRHHALRAAGGGRSDGALQARHRPAGPPERPDGLFTWQEVECLGACANAPMAQINDYYFEDLTPATPWARSSPVPRRRFSAAGLAHGPQERPNRRAVR